VDGGGLVALGVIFLFHAQHEAAGPAILLVAQHRILGATLCLAAVAKALAETGQPKLRPFASGWLLLVLPAGLQLLLYTEGGAPAHAGH
jgi:hypothetical protein